MLNISICGDVCPVGTNDLFVLGDVEALFHDVPAAFADSDRVLVNLETALTDSEYRISKKGPNLKGSPACAKVLKAVGVTDCGLCNNHVFDFGTEGILDTLRALEENGLSHTGFGENYEDSRKNLVMEKDGVRVAVIAVCEHEYCYALEDRMGARGYDPYDTIEDIRKAKAENDYVIVTYHGGKEQSVFPSPRLRKACHAMAKSGADVILCQHSHCIGCCEEYRGSHILYGQGNFHFANCHPDHPQWQTGLIARIRITDRLTLEFVPVEVVGKGIRLAQGERRQAILDELAANSAKLKNGEWEKGWEEFCESRRKNYIAAIGNAYTAQSSEEDNELFDHYLYCEAHMDVFRQLCKLSWETREEP